MVTYDVLGNFGNIHKIDKRKILKTPFVYIFPENLNTLIKNLFTFD